MDARGVCTGVNCSSALPPGDLHLPSCPCTACQQVKALRAHPTEGPLSFVYFRCEVSGLPNQFTACTEATGCTLPPSSDGHPNVLIQPIQSTHRGKIQCDPKTLAKTLGVYARTLLTLHQACQVPSAHCMRIAEAMHAAMGTNAITCSHAKTTRDEDASQTRDRA